MATKQQMVENLARTSAWKGGEAILNQMSEAQLTDLCTKEIVVNKCREGFGDIAINEMPAALAKAAKNRGKGGDEEPDGDEGYEEPDGDEPTENDSSMPAGGLKGAVIPPGKQTRNSRVKLWYDNAPPEIQQMALNHARVVDAAKRRIVDQLVANVANASREAKRATLMAMNLEQLEAIPLPTANSQRQTDGDSFAALFGGHTETVQPLAANASTGMSEEFALPTLTLSDVK